MKNMTEPKISFEKRSTCPMSSWLELFGDKWTLLIIRDMAFFGKKALQRLYGVGRENLDQHFS